MEVKPAARRFRQWTPAIRPEPALVARQARAATCAFRAFGDAEAARLFLNSANEALGGRPLDIAGGSEEGLSRVIAAMAQAADAQAPLGG